MACNCNKCEPSKCGCQDTALTNPCTYTDCTVGSERCEDIQCAECVSYCGCSFQIGNNGSLIVIESGERLDSILQKFALMISQGVGACTSNDQFHAPYNLYTANTTSTGVTLIWNGESSLMTSLDVEYGLQGTVTWAQANTSPILPGVNTFDITGLTPATAYKVRIKATGPSGICYSVELLLETLV
jgi:hypothetical protein